MARTITLCRATEYVTKWDFEIPDDLPRDKWWDYIDENYEDFDGGVGYNERIEFYEYLDTTWFMGD